MIPVGWFRPSFGSRTGFVWRRLPVPVRYLIIPLRSSGLSFARNEPIWEWVSTVQCLLYSGGWSNNGSSLEPGSRESGRGVSSLKDPRRRDSTDLSVRKLSRISILGLASAFFRKIVEEHSRK